MSKRVTSSAKRERGADAPARPPLVHQASQQRLSDAHEALQRTLEEVELVERELAQQNEELIAAREALEVERHRYRELFELAPDGYVISNAQGIVEEANQAAAALLNTSEIALRGKPLAVFVAPPGRQAFRSLLREVATAGRRADSGEEAEPHPSAAADDHGTEVLLLVEDEDSIREPATEILESRGYLVLPACGGAEALAVAQAHAGPIDLMITDVVMPGMNGNQLAEELRSSRPGMRVLFISGYPEDAIAHHGVLDTDKAFLQKPCPAAVLLRTVREVLDAGREAPAADVSGGAGPAAAAS
ncbi:MAG TPA: response regulator [Thermoanaerobaculia bacterium]|nr:response regulator [Thermoanaerobaculia bacterium]